MKKIIIPDVNSSQESLNHLIIDMAEKVNEIIDQLESEPNNPNQHDSD